MKGLKGLKIASIAIGCVNRRELPLIAARSEAVESVRQRKNTPTICCCVVRCRFASRSANLSIERRLNDTRYS